MKLNTRDIVYIGFIAALCAVATTIRIEIPGGAMVHLGSAALFTTSILFGWFIWWFRCGYWFRII